MLIIGRGAELRSVRGDLKVDISFSIPVRYVTEKNLQPVDHEINQFGKSADLHQRIAKQYMREKQLATTILMSMF
jgi:hypothetical protein